ncbi:hypothetical protein EOD29_30070 [Mesorhizobium sp. M1A.T.Ca.IN.004.03.1.1]|uniref:transcriptional repressor n=2 Tax=unclassified Mesorhizobium TaxID=325217 RepID=UPI000FCA7012|nr:transcriptional repressor [Mesorhizobium sp. M1A.T.Ca.IN.004.03.1.1]RUV40037.1 hypothetical protein EOD29_30070 [Mesorhizobium sp. M1A.T.Ca.IN.004.03.1.1]
MANSAQCQNCTQRACQDNCAFHYPNSHERIAEAVFAGGACHFTANDIHGRLESDRANISLEAVNDTLLRLTKRGDLRQLPQFSSQAYYDTNTATHAHIYDEHSGELVDVPDDFSDAIIRHLAELLGDAGALDLIIHRRRHPY